jgi:hypothetical protein
VYLAGLLLYAVLWYPGPPGPVLDELVRDGALLAAVLLFGDAVRSHRALMAESYERLRREARELSAARVIQQQLLPRELPSLPGWRMAAYYRPAREVGGDFYDLLELPDGQLPARASSTTATASSRRMTQEARCSAFRDSERWSKTAREAIT